MDFEMMCETLARKVFQCGRYDDPLGGRLVNTDSWIDIHDDEFSESCRCKAWAILARLQSGYLDSVTGREELYDQASDLEEKILNAKSNRVILDAMIEINTIVDKLNLKESPYLRYTPTNDNIS
ncbi:hypothetical protein [Lewinella sp. JB7]|uniref:hypothetical protein n=1 Tax=Lewinella sp. JB7 TaxID=2962887 RepID=UPI0020C998C0|nr:hypothetical protein [Lewinella sp. JB7]MCP9237953.1 hypothetical protein [Lewinella sp. JB7]